MYGRLPIAQAIVDTINAPYLVIDRELRVVEASRAYYREFNAQPGDTEGRHLTDLGAWDCSKLIDLLKDVLADGVALESLELDGEVTGQHRVMRVAAHKLAGQADPMMLMEITDITEARTAELNIKEIVQRKDMLLEEMSHRVANSLMIIASILLLRSQTTRNEETRLSLEDAHQRVIAIASVQKQLRTLVETDEIELEPYLSALCESLAEAMIDDRSRISLQVQVGSERVSSGHAVHIGLLATELVINALKHGFPHGATNGLVAVAYDAIATGWTLRVSDNGVGQTTEVAASKSGLGTLIVHALARRLGATVKIDARPNRGRITSISHVAPDAPAHSTIRLQPSGGPDVSSLR